MKILDKLNERFKKYSFIMPTHHKRFNEIVRIIVPANAKWCITERICGPIIQIYCDHKGFEYGNGGSFIKDDKKRFFNIHSLLPKFEDKAKQIYEKHKKPVRIFGKLLGGHINGKPSYGKGKPNIKNLMVCKEVEHCKDINVVFCDIRIGNKTVSYKEAIEMFKEYDIPYNPILKICSLDEALEYPNNFSSKIGNTLYNLPIKEENSCFGIVLKPYEKEYGTAFCQRVILKNTNPKFVKEIKKKRKITRYSQLSDKACKLMSILNNNVSEHKFETLFSKAKYKKKELGNFTNIFVDSLLYDAKENGFDFDSVKVKEVNWIVKKIKLKSTLFFKDWFFNRVEK